MNNDVKTIFDVDRYEFSFISYLLNLNESKKLKNVFKIFIIINLIFWVGVMVIPNDKDTLLSAVSFTIVIILWWFFLKVERWTRCFEIDKKKMTICEYNKIFNYKIIISTCKVSNSLYIEKNEEANCIFVRDKKNDVFKMTFFNTNKNDRKDVQDLIEKINL